MSKNKTNNSNIATKSGTKQLKVIKFSVITIGVICLLVCSLIFSLTGCKKNDKKDSDRVVR